MAEGLASVLKLWSGWLADRRARRPLIALGYGLAGVGKLLVAVAVVWPVVLAGRAVDRIGKGIRGAPRDALLMVDADPAARGRIFGFHRAADTACAVLGPAIGLGLYEAFDHRIRPLLWVALVPAVGSVLLVRWVAGPAGPGPVGPAPGGISAGTAPAVALAADRARGVLAGELPGRAVVAARARSRTVHRRGHRGLHPVQRGLRSRRVSGRGVVRPTAPAPGVRDRAGLF